MTDERPDWMEKIKEMPGYIRGIIGFLTIIVGFILFFLENFYLNLLVAGFLATIALFLFCIYVLLKKTKPLIVGGKGVYAYPKYRPLAAAGLIILTGGSLFLLPQTYTSEYIRLAFAGKQDSTSTGLIPKVKMVKIDEGKFIMGSNEFSNTSPERKVSIHSFWMDVYEVTNQEYEVFLTSRNYPPPPHWVNGKYPFDQDHHPVSGVSWKDAETYCTAVGKRLPTEAEWEKAARGIKGNIWPWGNVWDPGMANVRETGNQYTMPVGSYPKGNSDFGVADLAGNVAEWVSDWYQDDYYSIAPSIDPYGPIGEPINLNKVLRGGTWYDEKENVKSFVRLGIYSPDFPMSQEIGILYAAGFRCACNDCQP